MEKEEAVQTKRLSTANFILGTWLVLSPFILNYTSSAARWTQITFGIFIVLLAALRYLMPKLEWASWFAGLCGLWLIVAPFMLNYPISVAYWNEVITGILISTIAFWNLDTYTEHHHRPV